MNRTEIDKMEKLFKCKILGQKWQLTSHKKLFENTCWGANYHFDDFTKKEDIQIGKNRDEFVKQLNLKSQINRIPKRIKPENYELKIDGDDVRDHNEYYKTIDGKIVSVTSPYSVSPEKHDFITKNGYIKTEMLYNALASTYYKVLGV